MVGKRGGEIFSEVLNLVFYYKKRILSTQDFIKK